MRGGTGVLAEENICAKTQKQEKLWCIQVTKRSPFGPVI